MQKTKLVLAEEGENGVHSIEAEIEAEFTLEEFALFKTFIMEANRLADSAWIKDGMPSGLDITIDIPTGGISGKAHIPNWDDVAVVLHKFRPFGLNDEPSFFYKVTAILARRIDSSDFRIQIQSAKDQFSGKESQREFRLEANGATLNCEDTLNKFLNAREYHRDEVKEAFIRSLEQMLPDIDYMRPILCGMIANRVSAVFYVVQILQCLLDNASLFQEEHGAPAQAS